MITPKQTIIVGLNNKTPKVSIETSGKTLALYKIWAQDGMNLTLNPSLSIKITNQDQQQLLKTSLLWFMKDQPNTSVVEIMKKIEGEKEVTIEIFNSPEKMTDFNLQLEYDLI